MNRAEREQHRKDMAALREARSADYNKRIQGKLDRQAQAEADWDNAQFADNFAREFLDGRGLDAVVKDYDEGKLPDLVGLDDAMKAIKNGKKKWTRAARTNAVNKVLKSRKGKIIKKANQKRKRGWFG